MKKQDHENQAEQTNKAFSGKQEKHGIIIANIKNTIPRRHNKMGKSKAQDELKERLEDLYPLSNITDEEYIGDLIKEQGYTLNEMKNELGHKPHKMFVDIIMRDAQRTIAFEYHGEQHFALIGNMTKTRADLLANQMLDEEKSWILERIGIPLVSIPYDMYIDAEIIEQLIAESTKRVIKNNATLTECDNCQRSFPPNQLKHGLCASCVEKVREQNNENTREPKLTEQQIRYNEEKAEKRRAEQREARQAIYRKQKEAHKEYEQKLSENKKDSQNLEAIKEAQRRANREARREAYKLYKQSDEYMQQKAKAKEARKKERDAYKASPEYAKQKAEAKRKRREERERIKRMQTERKNSE